MLALVVMKRLQLIGLILLNWRCYPLLENKLNRLKNYLTEASHTSKPGLQYMNCVDVTNDCIVVEKLCSGHAPLQAISEILDVLVATAQNNYAKYTHFYLQQMIDLTHTNHWL